MNPATAGEGGEDDERHGDERRRLVRMVFVAVGGRCLVDDGGVGVIEARERMQVVLCVFEFRAVPPHGGATRCAEECEVHATRHVGRGEAGNR